MGRVAQCLLIAWVAVTLNFALPRAMPGNPLALLAGAEVAALSSDQRSALLADAGLDRPWHAQYLRYLGQLARADLGYSYQRQTPVTQLLAERLPWTLLLTLTSQALALIAGVSLGAWAAWRHGRAPDVALSIGVLTLEAAPTFWVGMLLIALLAVRMPLLPSFGAVTPWQSLSGAAWLTDAARHLVLPTVTLAIGSVSLPFLVTRASLLGALQSPFIVAARARGLSARRILFAHAAPNALLPVATAMAMHVASALGGAVLVETVFSYPGIGRLAYEAVLSRDYPVIQGTFLLTTAIVLAANVAIDLAQGRLDPRLRRRTT